MEMGRFFALALSGDTGKKQPPEIRPEGRAGLRKRWRQVVVYRREPTAHRPQSQHSQILGWQTITSRLNNSANHLTVIISFYPQFTISQPILGIVHSLTTPYFCSRYLFRLNTD